MTIFGLGTPEIILILVVFLLFFGKDRLPRIARNTGKSIREVKESFSSIKKQVDNEIKVVDTSVKSIKKQIDDEIKVVDTNLKKVGLNKKSK